MTALLGLFAFFIYFVARTLFYLLLCTIWVLIQLFKLGRWLYRRHKARKAAKNGGGDDFPASGEPPTVVMSPVR